jgi:hypothetical protein
MVIGEADLRFEKGDTLLYVCLGIALGFMAVEAVVKMIMELRAGSPAAREI